MKILITDIHHGNGGGHVTYILNLLEGLKASCDLTLASPPTGRLYARAKSIKGIRVLPGLYTSRPLTLAAEVLKLRRFLSRERFDVVHVNGGADHRHVMLARIGMRRPPAIVWTKHNTNPVDSVGHRLRARFGTDSAIAVCEYVQRQLSRSAYGNRPIHVVRNGIDPRYVGFSTAEQRRASRAALFADLPEDAFVFGSVGGTDYNKGWLLLLQAVARLPIEVQRRIRIVIAGDPPSAQMLADAQASGLDLGQVVFPGLVPDIRNVLAACDVGFVLSYREAASYASCETMAAGLPTLVSAAGGLPENVRDGVDGWVVPVGDVEALTRCVSNILKTSPETLASLGASAKHRIETVFSIPTFLAHTEQVYRAACKRYDRVQSDGAPLRSSRVTSTSASRRTPL